MQIVLTGAFVLSSDWGDRDPGWSFAPPVPLRSRRTGGARARQVTIHRSALCRVHSRLAFGRLVDALCCVAPQARRKCAVAPAAACELLDVEPASWQLRKAQLEAVGRLPRRDLRCFLLSLRLDRVRGKARVGLALLDGAERGFRVWLPFLSSTRSSIFDKGISPSMATPSSSSCVRLQVGEI